ncbi:MAG: hypothetical protein ACI3YE_03540 [Candidatus Avispirillum sp.]
MNYRLKYIRALSFAVFFCLIAVISYIEGNTAEKTADNRLEAMEIKAAGDLCDASREIRNAVSSGNTQAVQDAAQRALDSAVQLKVGSDVKRTLEKVFTDIKNNKYDDSELDTVLSLAVCSGTTEDICNICRRRTYTFSQNAENRKAYTPSAYSGRSTELHGSVLCKGIKYQWASHGGEYIYLYNENQYACVSSQYNSVVRFHYDCDIGAPKLDKATAEKLSKEVCVDCLPRELYTGQLMLSDCVLSGKLYRIIYSSSEGRSIYLSLRADTGSIVFFDASDFYKEF